MTMRYRIIVEVDCDPTPESTERGQRLLDQVKMTCADALVQDAIPIATSGTDGWVEITDANFFNPRLGIDRLCVCGHAYYRHFDGYDNNNKMIGCKYCGCSLFVEE